MRNDRKKGTSHSTISREVRQLQSKLGTQLQIPTDKRKESESPLIVETKYACRSHKHEFIYNRLKQYCYYENMEGVGEGGVV